MADPTSPSAAHQSVAARVIRAYFYVALWIGLSGTVIHEAIN
jgi:hypothetical protein